MDMGNLKHEFAISSAEKGHVGWLCVVGRLEYIGTQQGQRDWPRLHVGLYY